MVCWRFGRTDEGRVQPSHPTPRLRQVCRMRVRYLPVQVARVFRLAEVDVEPLRQGDPVLLHKGSGLGVGKTDPTAIVQLAKLNGDQRGVRVPSVTQPRRSLEGALVEVAIWNCFL